ncbi:MAG: FAD-binding oxidoreductase, partial [Dehalococcoidia bacterium]
MAAKTDLAKLIGKENVLDGNDVLESYSKDMSFARPMRSRCVAKPRTMEEVQKVVKWANETNTPLVPVSSGLPRFHGDTVPSVAAAGAVIVDVSGMKKIMRVDRRNRVCMVETGVTFGELIPALKNEGMAPLITFVPRSNKSVVTSFMEREPFTIPRYHWEAQDPVYCVEVIYGNGDMFRTGSAFGPGTLDEQWAAGRAQVRGMGPSQVDFTRLLQAAQGTMGIVTWASIKCRPIPTIKETYLVASDKLEPLIDFAYKIQYKKLGEELFIVNNLTLAAILNKDSNKIAEMAAALPPWVMVYSIDGAGLMPQEKVDYQREDSKELAQTFGLTLKKTVGGARADDVEKIISQPSEEPYWKLRYRGNCHDVLFLTTMDKASGFVKKMHELAGDYNYPAGDMGVYIQPTAQGTNCHVEFNLMFDPNNTDLAEKVSRLDSKGGEALAQMGAFFSRPYGPWSKFA